VYCIEWLNSHSKAELAAVSVGVNDDLILINHLVIIVYSLVMAHGLNFNIGIILYLDSFDKFNKLTDSSNVI